MQDGGGRIAFIISRGLGLFNIRGLTFGREINRKQNRVQEGAEGKKRCAIFLGQANRRAVAPGGARSLAGSLLRSSKALLGPRTPRRLHAACAAPR